MNWCAFVAGGVIPVLVMWGALAAGLWVVDTSAAPRTYLAFLALLTSTTTVLAAAARVYGHIELNGSRLPKATYVDLAGKWGALAVAAMLLGSSIALLGIDIRGIRLH